MCNHTQFFFRKKGYINIVPKSVRLPSVGAYLHLTFHVNASSPKAFNIATSNFTGE